MAITGSTDLGNGRQFLTVDHDPTTVATDALSGSLILNINNNLIFEKLDAGSTTNVRAITITDDGTIDINANTGVGSLNFKKIRVWNQSGATLTSNTAVYATGHNATENLITVDEARADDDSTRPAIGIIESDINDASAGLIIQEGILSSIDTTSQSIGNFVYLSRDTAGTFSFTPSAQLVGTVLTSANPGIIHFNFLRGKNARPLPGRNIFVDPNGVGDATTIADGLIAANSLTPTASNPVSILVTPSVYTNETNPLTVPDGVSIVALGGLGSVIVEPSTTTAAIFELETGSTITRIIARGANGVGGVGFRISGGNRNGVLDLCSARDCETGMLSTGAGSIMAMTAPLLFRAPGTTMTNGIRTESGGTINAVDAVIIGTAGVAPISRAISSVGTDSTVSCLSSAVQGATSGLYADNGGLIQMDGARFDDCTDALHVGPTGSGRILCGTTDIVGSTSNDIRIESATGTVDFIGVFNPLKRTIAVGATLNTMAIDRERGRGFIAGGLSVEGGAEFGTPGASIEFVDIGEGGPYNTDQFGVEIIEYWSYDASAVSGSRFSRFASNGGTQLADDGDAIVIGGRFNFAALKLIVSSAATLGTGNIVMEYWDGGAWVEVGYAAYGEPDILTFRGITPLANVETQLIEHAKGIDNDWTADDNVLDEIPDWDLGENMFALRLRNNGAITTGAQFTTGEVRGDGISIHTDGDIIFWGEARGNDEVTLLPSLILESSLNTPLDEDVSISTNISYAGTRNEFSSTALDKVLYVLRLPQWIDLASPITVSIAGYQIGTNTGILELRLILVVFDDGDVLNGTLTELGPFTTTQTMPGVSGELVSLDINATISTAASPLARIAIAIERDASAGNGNDTLGDNFVMTDINVSLSRKRLD